MVVGDNDVNELGDCHSDLFIGGLLDRHYK